MAKSEAHKRAQAKAAGRSGQTEVSISHNRKLDALSKGRARATEIERSGNRKNLEKAARRLAASGAPQRVLQVPNQYIDLAVQAMKKSARRGP